MTWGEARDWYLQSLRSRGLALSTWHEKGKSMDNFLGFCQTLDLGLPQELLATHLAAYRRNLTWRVGARGRLLSTSTVAKRLTTVRSFLRFLVAQGKLLVDPTVDLVIPTPPRPLPRLLTVDEVARLLGTPDTSTAHGLRDRAILETLYGLGLRKGECHQLELTDYDRAQRTLMVKKTKTRRERQLPVGPQLERALEDYLNRGRPALLRRPDEPALFVSRRTGGRISLVRLTQMVAERAWAAGLPPIHPHALRHACATHMLAGGAEICYVQALLGHQALRSTQRYTHIQPLELTAEYQRTHPRAKKGTNPPSPNPT